MGTLNCPVCGRTGHDQYQAMTAPGALDVNIGLDPRECGGCRVTLERAGCLPLSVDFGPVSASLTPLPEANLAARPDFVPSLIPRGLSLGGVE